MASTRGEAPGCQLEADVIIYSAMGSAYERASRWQSALQLLDEVAEVLVETDVVMQNTATWKVAIEKMMH